MLAALQVGLEVRVGIVIVRRLPVEVAVWVGAVSTSPSVTEATHAVMTARKPWRRGTVSTSSETARSSESTTLGLLSERAEVILRHAASTPAPSWTEGVGTLAKAPSERRRSKHRSTAEVHSAPHAHAHHRRRRARRAVDGNVVEHVRIEACIVSEAAMTPLRAPLMPTTWLLRPIATFRLVSVFVVGGDMGPRGRARVQGEIVYHVGDFVGGCLISVLTHMR